MIRVRGGGRRSVYVYYESIKREPKIRGIYECRCDERLQTKSKEFTRLAEHSLKCALETVTQTCNVSNLNLGITNPGQIDSCCYQLDCKNGGTIDYLGVCYCRCTPPFAGKECERRFSQVLCLAILATSNFLYMQGLTSESIGR